MIQAKPGATFEAVTKAFTAGSTVGIRIRDGEGDDFLARTVIGVTEDVTVGSAAVFLASKTAPTVEGQYWIVWDDGTEIDTEELLVTHSAVGPFTATGHEYVSLEELRDAIGMDQDYMDSVLLRSITAACVRIEETCNRRFWTDEEEIRYYRPSDPTKVVIDDLVSLSELASDQSGNGEYDRVWEVPNYVLEPLNAAAKGKPYTRVGIGSRANTGFPSWVSSSVRITGVFGWPAVPGTIVDAATLLATRLAKRKREAPLGVVVAGFDVGVAAHISRTDPDVYELLLNYVREEP